MKIERRGNAYMYSYINVGISSGLPGRIPLQNKDDVVDLEMMLHVFLRYTRNKS
jgi:hypothetical protein